MSWFKKEKQKLKAGDRRELPSDVFDKCPDCGDILYRERLVQNRQVCPSCGHHFRIGVDDYLALLVDEGTFEEADASMRSGDPLHFTDLKPYRKRLGAAERKTGRGDAVVTGLGRIGGVDAAFGIMNFAFIGGSMGSVVGEKIARITRRAIEERRPLILVSASGGARMMEGILSLMQMAKTSALLAQLHEARLPFVSILTDPTTGGVTASYAMLGDVNISEPGALIGFAGPRVIEQTIKQELPEGFQTAEFLLEHGMLDLIVDRRELKETVARLLRHMLAQPAVAPNAVTSATAPGAPNAATSATAPGAHGRAEG